MKIIGVKRNKKIEMLIFTIIVMVVIVIAFFSMFTKPDTTTAPLLPKETTVENNATQNQEKVDDNKETISQDVEEDEEAIQSEPIVKANFPLVSKYVPNIEITSTTNGICNGDTGWKLKFLIENHQANKDNKYAYDIYPQNGIIATIYDEGINQSEIDNALSFLYSEENGNIFPIINDGITWMPGEENFDSSKIIIKAIDLKSRNIESVFYITISKSKDEYVITDIGSSELTGTEKEKACSIALDYYKNKGYVDFIKDIDESIAAENLRMENDMYYVDDIAKNGIGMGPVITVYINYYKREPLIGEGCFILHLEKDTFAIIGEGKMVFLD